MCCSTHKHLNQQNSLEQVEPWDFFHKDTEKKKKNRKEKKTVVTDLWWVRKPRPIAGNGLQ